MEIEVRAPDISADMIETEINDQWTKLLNQGGFPELDELKKYGDPTVVSPFEVRQSGEGFGVVETILITIAARLISTYPERLMVQVFDKYIWPKIDSKFGGLKRLKDDE